MIKKLFFCCLFFFNTSKVVSASSKIVVSKDDLLVVSKDDLLKSFFLYDENSILVNKILYIRFKIENWNDEDILKNFDDILKKFEYNYEITCEIYKKLEENTHSEFVKSGKRKEIYEDLFKILYFGFEDESLKKKNAFKLKIRDYVKKNQLSLFYFFETIEKQLSVIYCFQEIRPKEKEFLDVINKYNFKAKAPEPLIMPATSAKHIAVSNKSMPATFAKNIAVSKEPMPETSAKLISVSKASTPATFAKNIAVSKASTPETSAKLISASKEPMPETSESSLKNKVQPAKFDFSFKIIFQRQFLKNFLIEFEAVKNLNTDDLLFCSIVYYKKFKKITFLAAFSFFENFKKISLTANYEIKYINVSLKVQTDSKKYDIFIGASYNLNLNKELKLQIATNYNLLV